MHSTGPGACIIKYFTAVIHSAPYKAVTVSHFYTSFVLTGSIWNLPFVESNTGLKELHSMGRFRALAANIRLGLKSPTVAKILACYSDEFLQKDYLSALDQVFK
jgi:hypothetical protein